MSRYSFRDVNETGTTSLPAEAMSINGTYIENVIDGYSTLYTIGRDLLGPEVESEEVGKHDGEVYLYKRYPARKITVGFQLLGNTPEDFRDKFNALNDILNVENAQLIFADETDKYFIGTPSGAEQPDEGLLNVISEFEILCVDPFKYSVEELEVEAVDGVYTVNYNGTYPAYPTLEASFSEDCGFVAWLDDDEKVVQIGDVNEEDEATYPKSQTLLSTSMTSSELSKWTKSAAVTMNGTSVASGSTTTLQTDPKGKSIASYSGITATGTGYRGAFMTRTLPADASSETGATDFRFSWRQRFAMTNGKTAQYGFTQVLLLAADNTVVAGVSFFKNAANNHYYRYYYVNRQSGGGANKTYSGYNCTYGNKWVGFASTNPPAMSIQKKGENITFNIGTQKLSFKSEAMKTKAVTKIQWASGRLGTVATIPSNQMGLISYKFVKDNCDTFVDIPNKFSEGDVVVVDCATGDILLNDTPMQDYGAIGNEFEGFVLSKGTNYISAAWSDWVETAPTLTLKYRERYL